MIKSFSYIYVGHVDMENLGFEGTPVNDRRYSNDHLITAFDTAAELAKTMDPLGYDALWLAEHHFQHEGYECLPNLPLLFVHLAHLTKSLRFGAAFNIVPMWHPLRLAEDFAAADVLTNGRAIFGIGRGYQNREVETLGGVMEDEEINRAMFEEQVEIIFKAFHEESFSYHGKYYQVPPEMEYRGYGLKEITLVPRPLHRPVEVWQPVLSANPRALDLMTRHRIKAVIPAQGGMPVRQMEAFRDAAARQGRQVELGEDVCFFIPCHISSSRVEAAREVELFYEESRKRTSPLSLGGGLTKEQISLLGDPTTARSAGIPPLEQVVAGNPGWLYGPADEVIQAIKDIEETYPKLEHLMVYSPEMTHRNVLLEQAVRFAEEVMPAFPDAIKRSGPDRPSGVRNAD